MKKIAVLGSTGSIGTQCLEIVEAFPEKLDAFVLTAHSNVDLLTRQALKFQPRFAIIAMEEKYEELKNNLSGQDITVLAGPSAIRDIVSLEEIDIVLAAIVGAAGIESTYQAIEHGKKIALANKESLVVAGDILMAKAEEKNVEIVPVDSEHSAIFQCLVGESREELDKIVLTASGGPFRTWKSEDIQKATRKEALQHPNWDMGAKISVDSASMMNKGLEMIEARWLFGLRPEQIDVVVHPQSIVHSFVQFVDTSMKAQCGRPDMKVPIQYALFYPDRMPSEWSDLDVSKSSPWTFEQARWEDFPCLGLARDMMAEGGIYPAVLNAANEIAVQLFLEDKIPFMEIPIIIRKTLENFTPRQAFSVEEYLETDQEARKIALGFQNN